GFMYPQGYFHQHVSAEGWQEESYERLNWADAPIDPAITADGKPCVPAVPLGERSVLVAVWRVRIGRVKLYLLDTDLEENAPWDRELSARLYGGDRETRIQQEIILGIGGVRALKALGSDPSVFYLNEGHAPWGDRSGRSSRSRTGPWARSPTEFTGRRGWPASSPIYSRGISARAGSIVTTIPRCGTACSPFRIRSSGPCDRRCGGISSHSC